MAEPTKGYNQLCGAVAGVLRENNADTRRRLYRTSITFLATATLTAAAGTTMDQWLPVRLVVFLIALIVLLCAQGFTAGIAWADVPLVLLNAVVVAMAAMGSYEVTFGRGEA